MLAELISLAYLARYPSLILGSTFTRFFFLSSNTSLSTNNSSLPLFISMEIMSPSSTKAITPPSAASGDTCPIDAPLWLH